MCVYSIKSQKYEMYPFAIWIKHSLICPLLLAVMLYTCEYVVHMCYAVHVCHAVHMCLHMSRQICGHSFWNWPIARRNFHTAGTW